MNLEQIKSKYRRLLEEGGRELLPLNKVISLEEAKLKIRSNYFEQVTAIDGDFNLLMKEGRIGYSELLKLLGNSFGGLTFEDRRLDQGRVELVMAFDYAMVNLVYQKGAVKFRIDLYWDN